jgi:cytochrome c553
MRKILVSFAIAALMAAPAMAAAPSADPNTGPLTQQYHSYDGLICTDCHTMHGSEDGAKVNAGSGAGQWTGTGGFRELLYKGDWTDMCLSCHKQGFNTAATADLPSVYQGYGNWTAPIVMTLDGVDPANISMPAGDFYYSNLDTKKGHNPAYTKGSLGAATSKLMAADTTLGSAPPGGTISDGEWSCHSCHGMHSRFSGSYTAYRQIKRKVNGVVVTGDVRSFGVESTAGGEVQNAAYEPIKSNSRGDVQGTNYVNTRQDGQALQGADLFADLSDTNKNVYQGGFSSFCSACHGDFHGGNTESRTADNGKTRSGGAWIKHPTNVVMDNTNGAKYSINTYRVTVTNAQGNNPNPVGYDWKYPLIKADSDFSVKSAVASATDPATLANTDRISCLTCHKAHASQYENMTRWDSNAHSFIASGATDFEGQASIGDNPAYGCGKCHQKGGAKAYVKSF